MATAPYRLVGRLKNNRLWEAIIERWPEVQSQTDAANALGISNTEFGNLLNMVKFPWSERRREYTAMAKRLAEDIGHPVEWLFDPILYGVKPPIVSVPWTPRALLHESPINLLPAPSPDEVVLAAELKEKMTEVLKTLTPREELVIRMRFGFDGGGVRTLDEVGQHFAVHRERIRQIELKALRKLHHPTRTRLLKPFDVPRRVKKQQPEGEV